MIGREYHPASEASEGSECELCMLSWVIDLRDSDALMSMYQSILARTKSAAYIAQPYHYLLSIDNIQPRYLCVRHAGLGRRHAGHGAFASDTGSNIRFVLPANDAKTSLVGLCGMVAVDGAKVLETLFCP